MTRNNIGRIRRGKGVFLGAAAALVFSSMGYEGVFADENVVYVSGDGYEEGGYDWENPLNSIYAAQEMIPEGGTIVVTGTFYIDSDREYYLNDGITIQASEYLEGPIFEIAEGGSLVLDNVTIVGNDYFPIYNGGTLYLYDSVSFVQWDEEIDSADGVDTWDGAVTYLNDEILEAFGSWSEENWETEVSEEYWETEAAETEYVETEAVTEAPETESEPAETEAVETEYVETEAVTEAPETESEPVETEAVETEAVETEAVAEAPETESEPVETEAVETETGETELAGETEAEQTAAEQSMEQEGGEISDLAVGASNTANGAGSTVLVGIGITTDLSSPDEGEGNQVSSNDTTQNNTGSIDSTSTITETEPATGDSGTQSQTEVVQTTENSSSQSAAQVQQQVSPVNTGDETNFLVLAVMGMAALVVMSGSVVMKKKVQK